MQNLEYVGPVFFDSGVEGRDQAIALSEQLAMKFQKTFFVTYSKEVNPELAVAVSDDLFYPQEFFCAKVIVRIKIIDEVDKILALLALFGESSLLFESILFSLAEYGVDPFCIECSF